MEKRKPPIVILIIALVLFAAGASILYSDYREKDKEKRQYEDLAKLATETSREESEESTDKASEETAENQYVSPIQFA